LTLLLLTCEFSQMQSFVSTAMKTQNSSTGPQNNSLVLSLHGQILPIFPFLLNQVLNYKINSWSLQFIKPY
jgi:hypothetical protein